MNFHDAVPTGSARRERPNLLAGSHEIGHWLHRRRRKRLEHNARGKVPEIDQQSEVGEYGKGTLGRRTVEFEGSRTTRLASLEAPLHKILCDTPICKLVPVHHSFPHRSADEHQPDVVQGGWREPLLDHPLHGAQTTPRAERKPG